MFRIVTSLLLLAVSLPGMLLAQVWTPVPEIGRGSVNALLEHRGNLLAATEDAVFRSTDGGMHWIISEPFPTLEKYPVVTALTAAGDRLFAGTLLDGVLASSDGGVRWELYNEGLAGFARRILGLVLRGDTLYAATDGAGVYARALGPGGNWRPFNTGMGWNSGNAIAVYGDRLCAVVSEFCFIRDTSQPAWESLPWTEAGMQKFAAALYVHDGYLFAGTKTGVFRWNGVDSLWSKRDLSPAPNRLVTAYASHGNELYAAIFLSERSHVLAVSSDDGESWRQLESPDGEVLAMLASNGRLWSARADGLWFRSIEAPTDASELPVPFDVQLHPPYPQPAAGTIVVSYELEQESPVTLLLYDALGRVAARLVDQATVTPGIHTLTTNLGNLPSGRYLLYLRSDRGSSVQSFIRAAGR